RSRGSTNRGWILKESGQAIPVAEPAGADGWVLGAPAVGKTLQGLLRIRQGGGTIDRPEVGRHGPALFPRDILQTVAYLMNNTELHLGLGKHRLDRLG